MKGDRSTLVAPSASLEAEQSVIGALLRDNDAIDRISDLKAEHFYDQDHAIIFRELQRQIIAGKRADVITIMEAVSTKIDRAGAYLNACSQSMPSSVNVARYAAVVIDRAVKRGLVKVAGDVEAWSATPEAADVIADRAARAIERLVERDTSTDPSLMRDLLVSHIELMEKRHSRDAAVAPISTGWPDLDRQLGGGLRRQTLTVVAARPAMGKTAFGLGIGRNVGEVATSLFYSMEMPVADVMDRNIAGLGRVALNWIMEPDDSPENWSRYTAACAKAEQSGLFIDGQTGLNLLQIRAKARKVKRTAGKLDLIVVDQLSFITGSEQENRAYALGEYTRGLVALAKELDCAVVLLCQLNRKCEDRPNKRPMCSDLADSGSIEQDAATIIFIYRDEVYNPDSPDKGIAEIIIGKARQGKTGTVALTYVGDQTRFESCAKWTPQEQREGAKPKQRGFP